MAELIASLVPATKPEKAVRTSNRRRRAIALAITLGAIIVVTLVAGLAMPSDFYASDFSQKQQAPNAAHWFGTDFLGHDMFCFSIRGLALSIVIGLFASAVSGFVALLLGSISAICGGWVDKAVLWLADLLMSIPHMVMLLLISFSVGGGTFGVVLAVALTHWPSLTRVIRAEVLRIRTGEFVAASRAVGKSNLWIAWHHVVPNVMPQFIVGTILLFPHAILHESALTFLGFGLPLDSPAIGAILSSSMKYLATGAWWLALFPGLMMVAIVLLTFTLGDEIKQLTDPHTVQE